MNVTAPETLFEQGFGPIADLVHAYTRERPRHPALIDEQRSLTYSELDQLMDRVQSPCNVIAWRTAQG